MDQASPSHSKGTPRQQPTRALQHNITAQQMLEQAQCKQVHKTQGYSTEVRSIEAGFTAVVYCVSQLVLGFWELIKSERKD